MLTPSANCDIFLDDPSVIASVQQHWSPKGGDQTGFRKPTYRRQEAIMTAQIAIMNKQAIALASDSAITVTSEAGQKVYSSANKLFALSKFQPVGIMVYGNAEIMRVNWETVIKIYRSKLGDRSFKSLQEYVDHFIQFLQNENPLFPEEHQRIYFRSLIMGYMRNPVQKITNEVKAVIKAKGSISQAQVKEITSEQIRKHRAALKKVRSLPSMPKTLAADLKAKYADIIDHALKDTFQKLPVSPSLRESLIEMSTSLPSKDVFSDTMSGVVIAGYGQEEAFPSLKSLILEGIVDNRLKYKYAPNPGEAITISMSASISAFAQQEMVGNFMEGVCPNLQAAMDSYLTKVFAEYPAIIVDKLVTLDAGQKEALQKKLREASDRILNEYQASMKAHRLKNYVEPVIQAVDVLPKDELAAMAESLVNLTVLKRRVTLDSETVGGPIDVAVISKGDGLVWIKRKHYFRPELNHQFFSNYYKKELS
jgi:hypothetical protein